jgi:hypothetical protein
VVRLASSNRAIVDVRRRADSWIAEAYRTGIVAKQRQKLGSLTKTIDHLEWIREQMLTLQRAPETGGVGQTRTANSEAHDEIED